MFLILCRFVTSPPCDSIESICHILQKAWQTDVNLHWVILLLFGETLAQTYITWNMSGQRSHLRVQFIPLLPLRMDAWIYSRGGLDSAWRSSVVSPWEQFVVLAVSVIQWVWKTPSISFSLHVQLYCHHRMGQDTSWTLLDSPGRILPGLSW